MKKLITNIAQLVNIREKNQLLRGSDLKTLPILENAYLFINDGIIESYGPMQELSSKKMNAAETIEAKGSFVMPCWCDSHTHLIFATSREEEFVDKIKGMSYAEIAARGGGILNSAAKLNGMPEETLYNLAKNRLAQAIKSGTGAIEIKSGYGLSVEGELKMLRVIKRLKKKHLFL